MDRKLKTSRKKDVSLAVPKLDFSRVTPEREETSVSSTQKLTFEPIDSLLSTFRETEHASARVLPVLTQAERRNIHELCEVV
jgi:hypothetical protein